MSLTTEVSTSFSVTSVTTSMQTFSITDTSSSSQGTSSITTFTTQTLDSKSVTTRKVTKAATFWSEKLVALVPNLRQLKVGAFVAEGEVGSVFTLEDARTGEVLRALKITDISPDDTAFHPNKGAHLASGIHHPSVCSPTHFFYLTGSNTITLTPSLGSSLVATIMPYVRGDSIKSKMDKIAERAECIFYVGLRLAEALSEFTRRGVEHGDLMGNILITDDLEPIIIDFDTLKKISAVSADDYHDLQFHLITLIDNSGDIKPSAKRFLLDYLHRYCSPRSKEHPYPPSPDLPTLPRRMVALMRASTDLLSAIEARSTEVFVSEDLEKSIQTHLSDS